jgi:large subunit ribosomal protein L3
MAVMIGLIGRKLGMTQVFTEDGALVPVTVIEAGPCPVVQVRTKEQDGYESIQVGFEEVKERRINSPRRGHLKKHGAQPMRFLREFRVEPGHEFKSGDVLTVEGMEVGTHIDVIAKSKGRGFQGVVKRHKFHGGPASHGSKTGNLPGSVGQSAYPNRVFKGKKLPGHMGDKQITALSLRVVKIDTDRNLVLVRGAVPGPTNGLVTIRPAIKKKGK